MISNVVGLVAQVAPIAGAQVVGAPKLNCSVAVQNALAAMNPPGKPTLTDQVTADTTALSDATNKVTTLTTQAQNDKSKQTALAAAVGDQAAKQATLNRDQAALTSVLKVLQDTQSISWPRHADEFRTDPTKPYSISPDVLNGWVTVDPPPPTKDKNGQTIPVTDNSLFDVAFAIYVQSTGRHLDRANEAINGGRFRRRPRSFGQNWPSARLHRRTNGRSSLSRNPAGRLDTNQAKGCSGSARPADPSGWPDVQRSGARGHI